MLEKLKGVLQKKKATKEEIIEEGISFEASKKQILEASQKRAWLVASCACVVALVLSVAVALLTPLKTVEPYVIRVSDTTGAVDIITKLNKQTIPASEALDKFFVSNYIKKREGYYYAILNDDYLEVQLFSAENVAADYRAIYTGADARDEQLKDKFEVEVQIISVVLGESAGTKTSTVRLNLLTRKTEGEKAETARQLKIVTLTYDYEPHETKEQYRLQNPLGFKVTNYRIDDEIRR